MTTATEINTAWNAAIDATVNRQLAQCVLSRIDRAFVYKQFGNGVKLETFMSAVRGVAPQLVDQRNQWLKPSVIEYLENAGLLHRNAETHELTLVLTND